MDDETDGGDDAALYTRAPTTEDLKLICGWLNEEGARYDVTIEFDERYGVRIPFASAPDIIRTKQTYREKDHEDCKQLARIYGL